MSVTLASFRALRAPAVGSHQYFYELRDQFAKVTDYLYLCSNSAALQTGRLRRLGVTAEVNVTPHLPYSDLEIQKMRIAVSDLPSVRISRYFQEFINFVNLEREKGGKVIVYCECGVSRSATLCMVYLIMKEKMTLYDAYSHIKLIRGIINPNRGFWEQMMRFERERTGQCSIKIQEKMT